MARERELRPLAGTFEGGKRRIVADGELGLEHEPGMELPLVEAADGTHEIRFTPGQKLRLVRDGSGNLTAIEISRPDGDGWKRSSRVSDG